MDTQAINTNDPSCNMKKSADLHAADEIDNNTQEKQNKQKLDNWDKFINLLGNWNRPEVSSFLTSGKSNRLTLKYTILTYYLLPEPEDSAK